MVMSDSNVFPNELSQYLLPLDGEKILEKHKTKGTSGAKHQQSTRTTLTTTRTNTTLK